MRSHYLLHNPFISFFYSFIISYIFFESTLHLCFKMYKKSYYTKYKHTDTHTHTVNWNTHTSILWDLAKSIFIYFVSCFIPLEKARVQKKVFNTHSHTKKKFFHIHYIHTYTHKYTHTFKNSLKYEIYAVDVIHLAKMRIFLCI